jgi:branched-chain amino acid transport system permease protein
VSLGHAGLLAAGAFTAGILFREVAAPFWITLPAAAAMGALLGVVFGLPSLRLRGLYLAVSTLALHFLVAYAGGEYEARRGFSTGILIDPPTIAGSAVSDPKAWYFILLTAAIGTLLVCANLLRSRSGRAWAAIRANKTVAGALGIGVAAYKLLAFVVSSALTAMAGALFAYYRGFVSVEVFSLFLSIQYVAMIIIGGMGSLLGAILGAVFVTLFPYAIEAAVQMLPGARAYAGAMFAVNYAAFGVVMILFLVLEPQGLVGIWRRVQTYFLLWPFRHRPVAGGRK